MKIIFILKYRKIISKAIFKKIVLKKTKIIKILTSF